MVVFLPELPTLVFLTARATVVFFVLVAGFVFFSIPEAIVAAVAAATWPNCFCNMSHQALAAAGTSVSTLEECKPESGDASGCEVEADEAAGAGAAAAAPRSSP